MGEGDRGNSRPARPVGLSGAEHRQLSLALIAAFDRAGLAQLARFHLDIDLDAVVGGAKLRETAFELVEWAIKQGRLSALVEGALTENPDNPELGEFERHVWRGRQPPAAQRPGEASGPDEGTGAGATPTVPSVPAAAGQAGQESSGQGQATLGNTPPPVLTGVAGGTSWSPDRENSKSSLWERFATVWGTIPDLLKALTALVGAVGTVVTILAANGFFDRNTEVATPTPIPSAVASSVPATTTVVTPAPTSAPQPSQPPVVATVPKPFPTYESPLRGILPRGSLLYDTPTPTPSLRDVFLPDYPFLPTIVP